MTIADPRPLDPLLVPQVHGVVGAGDLDQALAKSQG